MAVFIGGWVGFSNSHSVKLGNVLRSTVHKYFTSYTFFKLVYHVLLCILIEKNTLCTGNHLRQKRRLCILLDLHIGMTKLATPGRNGPGVGNLHTITVVFIPRQPCLRVPCHHHSSVFRNALLRYFQIGLGKCIKTYNW